MSNINAVGSSGISYDNLASGKRIQSAADDAAGLAISEKLKSGANGYDVGANNAASAKDAIQVADSSLQSITDSLQRMRELGVQASNGALYGAEDLQAMQKEIDQLKQDIQDTAKGTQYNKMNLLDGSKADLNVATNPDGSGMKIQMVNSTLEELGIADFDVTKDFNLDDIDKAIQKVSDGRSSLGAQSNRLENAFQYNRNASFNLVGANSRLEDLDYGSYMSEKGKDQVMQGYRNFVLQNQMQQDNMMTRLLQ